MVESAISAKISELIDRRRNRKFQKMLAKETTKKIRDYMNNLDINDCINND